MSGDTTFQDNEIVVVKINQQNKLRRMKKRKRGSSSNVWLRGMGSTVDNSKMITYQPLNLNKKVTTQPNAVDMSLAFEEQFLLTCPVKFYQHQLEAMRWMQAIANEIGSNSSTRGGVLADVMGLGKTISCLGFLYYRKFLSELINNVPEHDTTLVVAPLTLISIWKKEACDKFNFNDSEVLIYHGGTRRERLTKGNPMIIVTTYETIQKELLDNIESPLMSKKWANIILDEAHTARNPKSKTFKSLQKLTACNLFCITGTPIVNHPNDVRCLSRLCTPSCFMSGNALYEEVWLNKYMIRRTKETLSIPEKNQKDIWLNFTIAEREYYNVLENWARQTYASLLGGDTARNYQQILLILIRLRQACNHPSICLGFNETNKVLQNAKLAETVKELDQSLANTPTTFETLKEVDQSFANTPTTFLHSYSSKMLYIKDYVEQCNPDDKIVIFSQFTTMLDLIQTMLIRCGRQPLRIDGCQNSGDYRMSVIDKFSNSTECNILLASMKAGGVGLNLVCASHLILVDPWWNSSTEAQAFDRVHRIGQTKVVSIIRLLMKDTVEEDVLSIQLKKSTSECDFYNVGELKEVNIEQIHSVFNAIIKKRNAH